MKIAFYSSFRGSMTGGPQSLVNFLKHLPGPPEHKILLSRTESPITQMSGEMGCPTFVIGGLRRYAESLHGKSGLQRLAYPVILLELLRFSFLVFLILRREKPDVIWVRNAKALLPVGCGAWLSRTRIVWDVGMEQPSVGIVGRLHRLGFRLADAVVVQGESVFRHAFPRALVDRYRDKCRVIHSGLDPERATRLERATGRSRGEDSFVILCSGTICRRKNQGMLLEAVEPLLDLFPHASVLLAGSDGEPDYAASLHTRYARWVAAGRVRFLGWRDDVPELMGAAHLLVHAATNEGVPRVVLEAFHSGLPVVATRAGGIPDVITDGESGYLVEVGDVHALRERVAACIRQPELRERFATNGLKVVRERYNLGQWVAGFEQLFSETVR